MVERAVAVVTVKAPARTRAQITLTIRKPKYETLLGIISEPVLDSCWRKGLAVDSNAFQTIDWRTWRTTFAGLW
jgi:hypothetical protein